jgi:cation-transporting P-type ATPase E
MPSVVAEGRRVLGNVERVSDLFLAKSFYAMAISIATVVLVLPFPFLNRHLTIVTALTIGIPSFFLALMPNLQRFRPGFFRRVLEFAVPAGVIVAVSSYATYGYVLAITDPNDSVNDARSAAVVTLFVVSWWILVQVARPWSPLRLGICAAMLVGFLAVLYVPWLSTLFDLSWAPNKQGLVAVGIGVLGALAVSVAYAVSGPVRPSEPRAGRRSVAVAG